MGTDTLAQFKIHFTTPVDGVMRPQFKTVSAKSPIDARRVFLADEKMKGAIIHKTKLVRT